MATARKLPSGNYRVRVYDKATNKYKSFTAPTKKEAERLGADWLTERKMTVPTDLTVGEAVKAYIENKENILSPSTIRGYNIIYNNAIGRIKDIKIVQIDENVLQEWVNANAVKYAPKSVKSQYGLICAALRRNKAKIDYDDVRLPRLKKKEPVIPNEAQIAEILRIVEGTSVELPVTIAVTMGLRQSEIAALKWSDYDGHFLKIHSAKVLNSENKYIIKDSTKSEASTREIEVDELAKQRLDRAEHKSEFISPMLPSSVLRKFSRLCKANGLPHFTMHAQRHGNASIMLANGVPDKYAMKRLGQSSTNMIKNVYQHLYDSKEQEVSKIVSDAFSGIYDTKHDTKKD